MGNVELRISHIMLCRVVQMFLNRRDDDKCRACHDAPETIGHILSSCRFHEWTLMKRRHDRLLYVLVREIFLAEGIPLPPEYRNLYGRAVAGNFGPVGVTEIAVDQLSPTMSAITERRPDILIRRYKNKTITILEVAAAYESCLEEREMEKRRKYQPLAADLAKQENGWRARCVPVVVGDLGTIGRLRSYLDGSDLFWPNVTERIVTYLQREVVCASVDLLAKHLLL